MVDCCRQCGMLCAEEPSLLKIHCYRALLETVIVRNYADLKHSGLGSVKRAAAMTFAE